MGTVDVRGSAGKGRHVPPKLGGDVHEFEVFVVEGLTEDIIKIRLGFGAVWGGVVWLAVTTMWG